MGVNVCCMSIYFGGVVECINNFSILSLHLSVCKYIGEVVGNWSQTKRSVFLDINLVYNYYHKHKN